MAKEECGLIQNEKDHVCDPYSVELSRKRGINPVEFLKRIHNIPN